SLHGAQGPEWFQLKLASCYLKKITVLGQLWKRELVASQNRDALFKSETHSLSSESSRRHS
ncbi:MAG: hypothetical protein E7E41_25585, partial [Klebsiella oxytoca]|nr:hypothetical protein [Klebsiella oxytoca]MDU3061631.1 hypothetical protein [Klebsiella oxytoca]MDU3271713.1 hypothetical protein [Klebsiella oxytoca]MDU3331749.1 hypothetical protein [Klebsiella oxytoca]MDU3469431.1 hypothetical protein [Klebsiella oxytoca]